MKRSKSIRLFKNDWLEKLSHVHPSIPFLIWFPVSTFLMIHSYSVLGVSAKACAGLALMGLFVWTLTEYTLHRFVFHFYSDHPILKRLHYIFHGIHHDDPDDATRLVMPPSASLLLAFILFNFFRLFLGPVYVFPFFSAFLIGYLIYDYTHYYVHHFNPMTKMGKALKQHHMVHHFVMPEARYGVSSPLWDHVFGSMVEKPGTEHPAHYNMR